MRTGARTGVSRSCSEPSDRPQAAHIALIPMPPVRPLVRQITALSGDRSQPPSASSASVTLRPTTSRNTPASLPLPSAAETQPGCTGDGSARNSCDKPSSSGPHSRFHTRYGPPPSTGDRSRLANHIAPRCGHRPSNGYTSCIDAG